LRQHNSNQQDLIVQSIALRKLLDYSHPNLYAKMNKSEDRFHIFFHDEDHDNLIDGKAPRMCGGAVLSKFRKKSSSSAKNRSMRAKHANPLTSSSSESTSTRNNLRSNNRSGHLTQQQQTSQPQEPLPSKTSEGNTSRRPSLPNNVVLATSDKDGTTARYCMPVHANRTLTGISSSAVISSSNQGGYQQLAINDSKLREGVSVTTEDMLQEDRGRDADKMFQYHVPLQSIIQFDPHVISKLKNKHIQSINERQWRSDTEESDAEPTEGKSGASSTPVSNKRFTVSLPPLSEGPTDSELSEIQAAFSKIVGTDDEKCVGEDKAVRADRTNDCKSSLLEIPTDVETEKDAQGVLEKLHREKETYQSEAVALRKEIKRFRKELDNIKKVLPRKTAHWSDEAWDKIDSNIELDDSHFESIPTRETLPQKSKININLRHFKVDWKLDFPHKDESRGEAILQRGDADIDLNVIEGKKLNSPLSRTIRKVTILDEPHYYEDPDVINPMAESASSDESEDDSVALSTDAREEEPSGRTQFRGRQPERVERVSTKRDILYRGVKVTGPEEPKYYEEGMENIPEEEHYFDDSVAAKLGRSLQRKDHAYSTPNKSDGDSHGELRGIYAERAIGEETGQREEGGSSLRAERKSISIHTQVLASGREAKVDNLSQFKGGVVSDAETPSIESDVKFSGQQHQQDLMQIHEGLDQARSTSSEMQKLQSFDGKTLSDSNEGSRDDQEIEFQEEYSQEELPSRNETEPVGMASTKIVLNSPGRRGVNRKLPDAFAFWQERLHLTPGVDGAEGNQKVEGTLITNESKTQQTAYLDRFEGNQGGEVREADDSDSFDAVGRDDLTMVRDEDEEDRDDDEIVLSGIEEYRRDMHLVQQLLRKYKEIPNPGRSSGSKSTFSRGIRPNPSFSAEAPSDESTKGPASFVEIENIDAVIECDIEYRSSSARGSRDPDDEFRRHADLPAERESSIRSRRSVGIHKRCSLTLGISPRSESQSTHFGERTAMSDASTIKKIHFGSDRGGRDTFKDYSSITRRFARESKTQSTNSSIHSMEPSTVSPRKVGKLASQSLQFWESSK
jgi:hypothetical protein